LFDGYLPVISKENELAVWDYISSFAATSLNRYPTTLEEDIKILEKDTKENHLGVNERNCVLYRKSEKVALHFL